jgi:serine phosphatase RsbU (regulator of sigma subunit)
LACCRTRYYESDRYSLHAGDRLVLVTDGVTEAENAEGEFFDNERLEVAARKEHAGCLRCRLRILRQHAAERRLHSGGDDFSWVSKSGWRPQMYQSSLVSGL